jgi:hypothetical protein
MTQPHKVVPFWQIIVTAVSMTVTVCGFVWSIKVEVAVMNQRLTDHIEMSIRYPVAMSTSTLDLTRK